ECATLDATGGRQVAHVRPHFVLLSGIGVDYVPATGTVVGALDGNDLLFVATPPQSFVSAPVLVRNLVVDGGVEHQIRLTHRALGCVVGCHRCILRVGVGGVGHRGATC